MALNSAASITVLSSVLAVGCAHAGSGVGELRVPGAEAPATMQPKGRVMLQWRSEGDASRGQIEAALPDGRRFQGHFVQPRRTDWSTDYYGPYYNAWSAPWGRVGPWFTGPRSTFVTRYSEMALAHLESADGARMRCSFALYDPDRGLAGGGQGDCQLSTNEEVFDAVLRAVD